MPSLPYRNDAKNYQTVRGNVQNVCYIFTSAHLVLGDAYRNLSECTSVNLPLPRSIKLSSSVIGITSIIRLTSS